MNNSKNKKIISKKSGFTIVESLVAIFILVISLTGPMAFSQSGLRASFVSRDQIVAFYLAQDAIEYIKNVRDNNFLTILGSNNPNNDWLDDLDECLVNSESDPGCTVDTSKTNQNNSDRAFIGCNSNNPVPYGCLGDEEDGSEDIPLKIYTDINNPLYGFRGFDGDSDSIFSREVKIIPVDNSNINQAKEMEIIVEVRWNTRETVGARKITVKENIFDWASSIEE